MQRRLYCKLSTESDSEKIENLSTFGKVAGKSLLHCFLDSHVIECDVTQKVLKCAGTYRKTSKLLQVF